MYATKYTLTRRSPQTMRADVAALADYPRLATGQIVLPAAKPTGAVGPRPAPQPARRRHGTLHHSSSAR